MASAAIGCWPKRKSSATKRTAAIPPFLSALDQLAGWGVRSPGFFLERLRARACASARLRARPRAGRVSIRPPWVPRCLRRRFFFVWAIGKRLAEHVLDHVALRVEILDRNVLRIVLEGGLGGQPHELGLDRLGAVLGGEPLDLGHDVRQRHTDRIMHVDRDLALPAVTRQSERPHPGETSTRLSQPGRDRPGDLGIRSVQLHVEGHERLAGGHEGCAGCRVRLGWTEIGLELAGLHSADQLRRAAFAEEGALDALRARRELAVEEDWNPEGRDPWRDLSGRGPGVLMSGLRLTDYWAD